MLIDLEGREAILVPKLVVCASGIIDGTGLVVREISEITVIGKEEFAGIICVVTLWMGFCVGVVRVDFSDDTVVVIVRAETAFFVMDKWHDWVALAEPTQPSSEQVVLCAAVSEPWVVIALKSRGENRLPFSLNQSTAPVTEASIASRVFDGCA